MSPLLLLLFFGLSCFSSFGSISSSLRFLLFHTGSEIWWLLFNVCNGGLHVCLMGLKPNLPSRFQAANEGIGTQAPCCAPHLGVGTWML